MIIDYCPGGDLSLLIAQMNTFTEDQARFYICEIILAIESLHKMGVLYRDLKPENILLDEAGHIKLADFGLSRENLRPGDLATSFCGSPVYLSPEMIQKRGVSLASDIYGIGVIFYEMLYGITPFYCEDIPRLYNKIEKEKLHFPENVPISPEARDLLSKLLKKDPKKRIGYVSKTDIKSHPFFEGINWEDVYNRRYDAPFVDESDSVTTDDSHRRRIRINDRDYNEENYKIMRVEGFEYVNESEIDAYIDSAQSSVMSNA